jgi:hypothetical protein
LLSFDQVVVRLAMARYAYPDASGQIATLDLADAVRMFIDQVIVWLLFPQYSLNVP